MGTQFHLVMIIDFEHLTWEGISLAGKDHALDPQAAVRNVCTAHLLTCLVFEKGLWLGKRVVRKATCMQATTVIIKKIRKADRPFFFSRFSFTAM